MYPGEDVLPERKAGGSICWLLTGSGGKSCLEPLGLLLGRANAVMPEVRVLEQLCPCRAGWLLIPLQCMVQICSNEPRGCTHSVDAGACAHVRAAMAASLVRWGLLCALPLTHDLVMLQLQSLVEASFL